jgi:histidine kinase/histidine kinase/DNA gyrase B/HSP90-like ATPase
MVNTTNIASQTVTRRNRPRSGQLVACGIVVSLLVLCFLLGGCRESRTDVHVTGPTIKFTGVPSVSRSDALGDAAKLSTIKGRVIGAQPGQQIVVYARAINEYGQWTWFVQPFVRDPWTKIQSNSTWRSSTHPGGQYAALLVEPGFQPPWTTPQLPTQGVAAVAITQGWPPIWQSWWFPLVCVLAGAASIFALYGVWLFRVTNTLKLRFEERLAERMRVAQELHDTLLQGVISASMQLDVAVDQMPADSPAQPALRHILQIMGQVIEEGRNTLRGLRSSTESELDMELAFTRIPKELGFDHKTSYRVIVEGTPNPLQPIVHDEIYSIGREALVNAFRHSGASSIEVELEYAVNGLRILVRDNGCGIKPEMLRSGREGHWGLSGMRERAERIGAKLKVMSGASAGTEVELSVPGHIVFRDPPSNGRWTWLPKPRLRIAQHDVSK